MELEKLVKNVDRISGGDRVETSLKIAEKYFKLPKSVFIANGWNNADALIGGYFAAMNDGPILLTNNKNIDRKVEVFIKKSKVNSYILGGASVISGSILKNIGEINKVEAEKVDLTEYEKVLKEGAEYKDYSTTKSWTEYEKILNAELQL